MLITNYGTPPKASATAVGSTSAPTYASASFAVIPEMTVTLTTSSDAVRLMFSGTFSVLDDDDFNVALFSGGVEITGTRRRLSYNSALILGITPGSITATTCSIATRVTGLSVGSHTFDVRWSRAAGTARAVTTMRRLDAEEV